MAFWHSEGSLRRVNASSEGIRVRMDLLDEWEERGSSRGCMRGGGVEDVQLGGGDTGL